MSEKLYDVPADWAKRAFVDDAKYQDMYARSISDPNGFWGDQGNTAVPGLLSTVKALAMTSYGLASTITGTVYVPLSPALPGVPGGNVSFFVTGQSPDDPNSGVTYGQAITLPLSYVSAA